MEMEWSEPKWSEMGIEEPNKLLVCDWEVVAGVVLCCFFWFYGI